MTKVCSAMDIRDVKGVGKGSGTSFDSIIERSQNHQTSPNTMGWNVPNIHAITIWFAKFLIVRCQPSNLEPSAPSSPSWMTRIPTKPVLWLDKMISLLSNHQWITSPSLWINSPLEASNPRDPHWDGTLYISLFSSNAGCPIFFV